MKRLRGDRAAAEIASAGSDGESEGSLDKHGQWMLFAVGGVALAAGFTLIGLDKPVEGVASVVGTVGTAVGLTVWSTRR